MKEKKNEKDPFERLVDAAQELGWHIGACEGALKVEQGMAIGTKEFIETVLAGRKYEFWTPPPAIHRQSQRRNDSE